MANFIPKTVLITGATSGLGAALAFAYAEEGVTLYLLGRNVVRLQAIQQHCEGRGATCLPKAVDVTDGAAKAEYLNSLQTLPDLIIANAGISGGTADGVEGLASSKAIIDTNVTGVINTVAPLWDKLAAHAQEGGQGQIAIIASLAGYRGFPGAPVYCASKAAAKVYGEAMRGFGKEHGVAVTTVCPGYIKTPMTDANDFTMPLMWPADKTAEYIKRKLPKNPARLSFPKSLTFVVWLLAILPASMVDWLLAKLPRKK